MTEWSNPVVSRTAIETLQSRIAHLEHLLSIALPVARAAIEEDARIVDVLGTKFSGTRRLIRALSPEERVEILEGGTE